MLCISELFICLTLNLVFQYGLGLSMLGRMVRGKQNPLLLSMMVTIFCVYGAVMAYLLKPLLQWEESMLIQPLVYILASALLYLLLLLLFAQFPSQIRKTLAGYLHQTAFSCIVMGCFLLTEQSAGNLRNAFLFGLRCGIGFFFAACIISIMSKRLNSDAMPRSTRGWPAVLIYTGVISLALSCITQK